MNYRISHSSKKVEGDIQLPTSKSISNRALIIQALCSKPFQIHHLAKAKDTQTLQEVLQSDDTTINVGDAGTAMRFLTAFLSTKDDSFVIGGSERMRERPIEPLVTALNQLGANIIYLEKEGYPPIQSKGKITQGGSLKIDAGMSSQYLTALLLIAPTLTKGLTLHLEGTVVSKPYIEMTLQMMDYFGVKSHWIKNNITIPEQAYEVKDLTIEADWSAAAFWFELIALSNKGSVFIEGLQEKSWQGDQEALALFSSLGVEHRFTENGLKLQKGNCSKQHFIFNLLDTPDLAQAICCTLAGLNKSTQLSGLQTLSIKETDRLHALQKELGKLGVHTKIDKQSIQLESGHLQSPIQSLATHNDHRMAMCLAPLALATEEIIIEDIEVVSKSYPTFWEDLKKVGFKITPVTDSSS